ncbi:cytochrome P450 81Q32 [Populus alba]|nr:cytochrome P450 81Q32-like [Populus alba]
MATLFSSPSMHGVSCSFNQVLASEKKARQDQLFSIRRKEVMALLRRLHGVSKHGNYAKVELRSMLFDLTCNIIMRMVAGKRYYGEDVKEIEEARIFKEIMEEFAECIAVRNLGDMIPLLQWIDFTGHLKKLDRLSKKMDVFLQGLVDEHRDDRDRNTMINRFLALQEEQPEYYTDEVIKGHVLVLLLGGTETAATSMEWALANLLNHPDVLKKAKAELDAQVGDRLIEESDFAKLHYLQSIISENLRLCPVTPLIPPHMPSSDCTIGGYHVPAGTILFVNARSLHRDPTLWDEPTSFKPERFESAGRVDAWKFIPFGMGRRACPGDGLANRVMTLTLGSLIQCFEWERVGENKIDMLEKTAMTMFKVEPLELMCRARPILDMLFSLSDQKI